MNGDWENWEKAKLLMCQRFCSCATKAKLKAFLTVYTLQIARLSNLDRERTIVNIEYRRKVPKFPIRNWAASTHVRGFGAFYPESRNPTT